MKSYISRKLTPVTRRTALTFAPRSASESVDTVVPKLSDRKGEVYPPAAPTQSTRQRAQHNLRRRRHSSRPQQAQQARFASAQGSPPVRTGLKLPGGYDSRSTSSRRVAMASS